jgi:hypothetical protein
VLIGGEPGIGKTHLVEAFADEAAGALVLWGRCQETEGAPPFWPWRQVLRALVSDVDAAVVRPPSGLMPPWSSTWHPSSPTPSVRSLPSACPMPRPPASTSSTR